MFMESLLCVRPWNTHSTHCLPTNTRNWGLLYPPIFSMRKLSHYVCETTVQTMNVKGRKSTGANHQLLELWARWEEPFFSRVPLHGAGEQAFAITCGYIRGQKPYFLCAISASPLSDTVNPNCQPWRDPHHHPFTGVSWNHAHQKQQVECDYWQKQLPSLQTNEYLL